MEKRIKQLEVITRRLMLRSKKKTSALITPYPISNALISEEVKGVVLRYMFPCGGKITKGVIDLGKVPKQNVTVGINLMGKERGESRVFILDKKNLIITPNIKVDTLDKLTISISYEADKPENNIIEFWTTFLWVPEVKDIEVKSFLIDKIENDLLE